MQLVTPRRNQGQIVTVSYGAHDGILYRHHHDASDRSESWERATRETNDDALAAWDGESAPSGVEWMPCAKPSFDLDA